ncbi:hypothetical protein Patl1_14095 [Pistacia atlantica]|uniref:Uncharacterized protein n=1 Tax=Pistacia atlantica TaxID=434234 RepID=A0ACC1ATV8_9ROSI|nr:hypothetical protein Patl1_14095 [Pistacia atlantica]
MSVEGKESPNDLEAGPSFSDDDKNPFNITRTKDATIERLRRWRQAALVLNASRRFRYTLDLKKEEEKKESLRKIRAHVEAIRAAYRFKGVLQDNGQSQQFSLVPSGDFPIGQEQLTSLTSDHNISALQQCGGASPPSLVKGLSDLLKTNLEKGINGDDADLLKRKNIFGSNTYPQKKGRSFWMFLWEAWQDLTLIILMVAAVASLALGIKTEVSQDWAYPDYTIVLESTF